MELALLRETHPVFTYHSYDYRVTAVGLELAFHFSITPDIEFHPQVLLEGVTQEHIDTVDPKQLDTLVFHLGLMEIPSYWKATCSPVIKIEAGYLTDDQIAWWKKLLLKGLGEFFYRNQIDFTGDNFVTFQTAADSSSNSTQAEYAQPSIAIDPHAVLVPLGGGKDSLVTWELLKQADFKVIPFALNPITAVTELVNLNPNLTPIVARRTIDPTLLELNRRGYLNGHTPFSAYLAFTTYLVASLYHIPSIALSNERSASEGNVEYLGTVVNHQYSKSLEFENDFRDYVARWLTAKDSPSPAYFSFLRPLHEVQIGHLFAQLTSHDSPLRTIFRSCNVGQRTNSWCGECAKCLFAWLMLFPFLGEAELIRIFGQNLFAKESLIDEALNLIHPERVKPWECVGTREESQVALYLSTKWYEAHNQPLPVVLERLQAEITQVTAHDANRLLHDWSQAHNLPTPYAATLAFTSLTRLTTRSLIIFGLGREGLSTYRFLRRQLPNQKITVVDEKPLTELHEPWSEILDQDHRVTYAQPESVSQQPSMLIFRSAGIPRKKVEQFFPKAEISSNTQLFFELIKTLASPTPHLITIGVTGTKGKSTTAAAIHHVLKENAVPAYLGGNIGKPPLEVLQEALAASRHMSPTQPLILVLELSSHQLSDVTLSPQLAVVQDVVPEHLDYYADFDEYCTAKSQITRYQTDQDLVVFNADSETATNIATLSHGQRVGFSLKDGGVRRLEEIVPLSELKVVGQHNYLNLFPAVVIGQHLGLTNEQIASALKTFSPLPHRLEKVTDINGVTFVNDSLATNPHATIAALEAFPDRPLILIAGGYDRGLDYTELGATLSQSNVKALIVFKPTGEKILEAVTPHSPQLAHSFVETMSEAVTQAWQLAQPGDVILMSPASASFGTFTDYADRGYQFAEAVRSLS